MTRVRTVVRQRRRTGRWALAPLLAVVLAGLARAESGPSLSVTPQQRRVQVDAHFGVIPLWDTTWWVNVEGHSGAAPLQSLEYHARFTDGPDLRTHTGTMELGADDRNGFSGRITIVCPTRPDYLRPLRVRLRLRDTNNAQSEWVDAYFPVKGEGAVTLEKPSDAVPVTTEAGTERAQETVGTVEVEVNSDTTIAEVREELQKKALAQGGNAVVGFRLVSSTGEQNTFAADVVRYIPPTPVSTAAPDAPRAQSPERQIGEIVLRHVH